MHNSGKRNPDDHAQRIGQEQGVGDPRSARTVGSGLPNLDRLVKRPITTGQRRRAVEAVDR